MKKTLFAALTAFCLFAAGTIRAQATYFDGVAAYVNSKVITVDTVMRELATAARLRELPPAEQQAQVAKLFPVVRDELIDRILILEAFESSGAQLPQQAVTERVNDIVARDFGGDEARLIEELRRIPMTKAEWVRRIRENIIVQAMQQLQVGKKTQVTPRRVKEYIAEHIESFEQAAATQVISVILPADTPQAEADKALAEIKSGKKAEDVGKAFKAEVRDWGFVKPSETFNPQIAAAVEALKKGESVLTQMGAMQVILQAADVRRGKRPVLSEIWSEAEQRVRSIEGMKRYKQWVENLRSKAFVKTVDVPLFSK